jgi:nucleoside-diphosphate-sugar epimerase
LRALIAGCGYVGTALAERLAAGGCEVFGLRRTVAGLPAAIRPLAADLTDPATLDRLPGDLDFVFYTAGAERGDEPSYRRAYVEGVRNLLAALAAAPRRLLVTSSTAVYAQDAGEWVDEGSETAPAGFRGRILLEAERCVLAAPFPATVLRLGGIYGPSRTRLVEDVRAGRARFVPGRFTNRIHRDDAAGALEHLAGLDAAAACTLGVDCDPAEERVVLEWLAERLGAPRPRASEAGEDAAASRRAGSKRCCNARLLAAGYRFQHRSFREGYAALLAGGA